MTGSAKWILDLSKQSSLDKIGHWSREDIDQIAEETRELAGLSDPEIKEKLEQRLKVLDSQKYYGETAPKSFVEVIPYIKELWKALPGPAEDTVQDGLPEVVEETGGVTEEIIEDVDTGAGIPGTEQIKTVDLE